jgi:3-phytase
LTLSLALALLAAGCAGARVVGLPTVNASARLMVIGDAVLPSSDGTAARPDVGGLSGAYYDARRQRLYAVSDDRERPRLVTLEVTVSPTVRLTPTAVVPLQLPHQGRRTLDAEGIAPAPNGRLYVSSEGNAADPNEPVPGIYEYTRQGRFVRSLPLPRRYLGSGDGTGMRDNGAFEGLTVSPDGRRLFAATESSLRQDGDAAAFDHGAVSRILVYELPVVGAAPREYAYQIDPVPRPDTFGEAQGEVGVAEILALSGRELLVLERGYVKEVALTGARSANSIRIYHVRLTADAEITGRTSLVEDPPAAPLRKTLVLDAANIAGELSPPLRALENFEAMTFGPRLPDGSASLMLVSDDNFSARQVTAIVVLAFGSNAPP